MMKLMKIWKQNTSLRINSAPKRSRNSKTDTHKFRKTLRLESLESRELLSVTPANIEALCADSALIVNSSADGPAGNTANDEFVTLREAVEYANAHSEIREIRFADGIEKIVLTEGELHISGNFDLVADAGLAIDGNQASRIFRVTGGTETDAVVFCGLTLQNGNAMSSDVDTDIYGGAVLLTDGGWLSVQECGIFDSSAAHGGGAIGNDASHLLVSSSRISGNSSMIGGAVIDVFEAETLILNSVLTNNSTSMFGAYATDLNSPCAFIVNSTFAGNQNSDLFNDSESCCVWNSILSSGISELVQVAGSGSGITKTVNSLIQAEIFNEFPADQDWKTWNGAPDDPACTETENEALPLKDGDSDPENDVYSQMQTMGANSLFLAAVEALASENGTDISGTPRTLGGSLDIGAYESPISIQFVDPDGTHLKEVLTKDGIYDIDGSLIEAPTPPERDLYYFTGWDQTWENAQEDRTITAQYQLRTSGTSITVDTAADSMVQDGKISLREAVQAANDDSTVKEIRFASGISAIHLTEELLISGNFDILADGISFTAEAGSRFFNVTGGTDADAVILAGMTLSGAILENGENGAAIYVKNGANLKLDRASILSCETEGAGGAVMNSGNLTLTSSLIAGCSAGSFGGGAIYSTNALTIVNCTIVGNTTTRRNSSSQMSGAAIYATSAAEAKVTIRNSIIVENGPDLETQMNLDTQTDSDSPKWDIMYSMTGSSPGKYGIAYTPDVRDQIFAEVLPTGSGADSLTAWQNWSPALHRNSPLKDQGTHGNGVPQAFGEKSIAPLREMTDLLGNVRLSDEKIDIGAVESVNLPLLVTLRTENGKTLYVEWESVEGCVEYSVQYRDVSTSRWTTKKVKNATTLKINAKAGTTWEVRVTPLGIADAEIAEAQAVVLAAPKMTFDRKAVKDDTFTVNVSNFTSTNLAAEAETLTLTLEKVETISIALENGYGTGTFSNGLTVEFRNGLLTFTNAQSNTQYKIKAQFANGTGTSALTSSVNVKTTMAPYLVPNIVSAIATGEKTIEVSWEAAYGKNSGARATKYTIQYYDVQKGRWSNAGSVDASKLAFDGTCYTYTISRLTGGSDYLVRVFAAKDRYFLASENSGELSARTWLSTPKITTVSTKTAGTAEVSWKAANGAVSYLLSYAETGTQNWVTVPVTAVSGTVKMTIFGLTSGAGYDFKVQALAVEPAENSLESPIKTLRKVK